MRWWKTYGGTNEDVGNSVRQITDGGYIIAGSTRSFGAGHGDVYLIKADAQGDTLWTRTYGGTQLDWGSSVQHTSDGGYIIAGYTQSSGAGNTDVYLIKTDAQGDTLWTRTYGGIGDDYGYSVQQTTDGGYAVVGHAFSFGAGNGDVYLIKTNALGDTLWTRTYGGTSADYAFSAQQTADSGYIIAGYTSSFGAGYGDIYLVKTDASGDTLWTRAYGGTEDDWGYSVQQTTDGSYIVAGYTASSPGMDFDVYLVKTNASGDTLWTSYCGGPVYDEAYSVQQTTDGGYIVAGCTNSFGTQGYEVYLINTNAQGDTLWTRTYGGINYDYGNSVQQTTDGGYIIAGHSPSFGNSEQVYLIKTDANGYMGLVDESSSSPPPNHKMAATVVRSLPECAVAFDAMGRRVLLAKPGIYFLRTMPTAAPRKVLLVE